MTDRETCLRWLGHIALAGLLAAAIFTAFPTMDLALAHVFSSRANGFLAAQQPILQAIRSLMILLTDGVMAVLALTLAVNLIAPSRSVLHTRVLAFCLTGYAVGPGLITNGILKHFSERARPRDILELGGDVLYSPPFDLAGQCSGNCSFVSGETSALTAVAVMILLIVLPQITGKWRTGVVAALIVLVMAGSTLRVVFGAHFPSDVIFAILITSPVVISLYLAFGLHGLASPFADRDKAVVVTPSTGPRVAAGFPSRRDLAEQIGTQRRIPNGAAGDLNNSNF